MTPCEIIKKSYGSIKEISRSTGMNYETLVKNRIKDDKIGSLTLNELWILQRHGNFTDEEILNIAKWKGGT